VRGAGLLRAGGGDRREHDIWVIHDLAYADLVFDGYVAPSILQVPGAKDIAVEFFTLSKSYNMPGWRVGFMCGNKTLVAALARMKSYLDYGMFTPIQVAAITALEGPQDCVREIAELYRKRRDVLCDGLNAAGWEVEKPKATMFVWAPIPEQYRTSARWSSPRSCWRRPRSRSRRASASVRIRRRPCALRPDRKRAPHPAGGARHPRHVQQKTRRKWHPQGDKA
jgi:histidinol-phosphate/aromatic aminotransferase/cobyric acid decarboxylase-like protein